MSSKVELVCRQTNYSKEEAIEKLKENNDDELKVIRLYFGLKENNDNKLTTRTISQERYKVIRNTLGISER